MSQMEFEGKNTELAIEKACAALKMPVEKLKVTIISAGSSGIFGLGGRKAKISVEIATPKAPIPTAKKELAAKKSKISTTSESFLQIPEKTVNPTFKETSLEKIEPKEVKSSLDLTKLEIPPAPTVAGNDEETITDPNDSEILEAVESLTKILTLMGFEVSLTSKKIADRIVINIDGEVLGLLIGKKGSTLDALQFIVNKTTSKQVPRKNQIILDVEDYRLRRHEAIIDLAKNMAEKAWRLKRPISINHLSAPERRIVHLLFQNVETLRTKSRGSGLFKSLVIIPLVGKYHNPPSTSPQKYKQKNS